MELTSQKSRRQIFMKLTIEFEQTKITLSVGSEGVTIDAPDPVEQESRQTTLSEARWAAYAQGREDEREEHYCCDSF